MKAKDRVVQKVESIFKKTAQSGRESDVERTEVGGEDGGRQELAVQRESAVGNGGVAGGTKMGKEESAADYRCEARRCTRKEEESARRWGDQATTWRGCSRYHTCDGTWLR